jgi:hypothetical protein
MMDMDIDYMDNAELQLMLEKLLKEAGLLTRSPSTDDIKKLEDLYDKISLLSAVGRLQCLAQR